MRKNVRILLNLHGGLLGAFILLYTITDMIQPGVHFGPDFNPVYFGVITHATIGYGDITPQTALAKTMVVMHVMMVMLSTIIFTRL